MSTIYCPLCIHGQYMHLNRGRRKLWYNNVCVRAQEQRANQRCTRDNTKELSDDGLIRTVGRLRTENRVHANHGPFGSMHQRFELH